MINPRDIPSETVRVATEAAAIATQNQTELRSLVEELKGDLALSRLAIAGWLKENGPGGWIDELRRENERLEGMIKTGKPIENFKSFEKCALENQSLTTQLHTPQEQNKSLVAALAGKHNALRELYDWQNGPPLVTYTEGWNNAMALAVEALKHNPGRPILDRITALERGLEEAVKALECVDAWDDKPGAPSTKDMLITVRKALATAQPLLKPLISDKEVSRDA